MGRMGLRIDSELVEIQVGDYSRLSANRRVSSNSVSSNLAFCTFEEALRPLVSESMAAVGKLEGWVVGRLDP